MDIVYTILCNKIHKYQIHTHTVSVMREERKSVRKGGGSDKSKSSTKKVFLKNGSSIIAD